MKASLKSTSGRPRATVGGLRASFVLLGILLFLGSVATGCVNLFVRLAVYEPPHPTWSFPVRTPIEPTTTAQTPSLSEGEHVVWIDLGDEGTCSLAVHRMNGAAVGDSSGTRLCRVEGAAKRDEIWLVEASASRSTAVYIADDDEPLLPSPLWQILLASVLGGLAGLALIIVGVTRKRPLTGAASSSSEGVLHPGPRADRA